MKRLLSNTDGFKRPSESIYFRYSKETWCWMMNVRCHRNVHLRGQLYQTQTVETLSGIVFRQEKTIKVILHHWIFVKICRGDYF